MIYLAILLGLFPSNLDTPAPAPITASTPKQKNSEHTLVASDNFPHIPQKGARVYLIGDFLYWSANQEGLNFAYKAKGYPGQLPLIDFKIKPFDCQWKPGFRVGLGYRLPHDKWEAKGFVTQFRTTNSLKQKAHSSEFIEPNFGQLGGSGLGFREVMGTWHLKYTLLDFELARAFFARKTLAISPFLGARGAWIHESTRMKFSGANTLGLEEKTHYRAGGLRGGSDLSFYWMEYVYFFAQASASLLSGRFEDETQLERDTDILFSGKTHPQRLCANCELRAGVKGTIPLYRKEAFLTLGLTYDMSLWFFQNQLIGFLSTPPAVQVQTQPGNLSLRGITLTTRLDF